MFVINHCQCECHKNKTLQDMAPTPFPPREAPHGVFFTRGNASPPFTVCNIQVNIQLKEKTLSLIITIFYVINTKKAFKQI